MARDLNVDQIRKLWILDLIIQSGSFKKAALRAKVSPSAISQSLSSLELALGKPLLVRGRDSLQPTADARLILDVVRPAFAAFDRLRNLKNMPLPQMSWLNLGTYESLAIDVLPGLIASLRERIPELKLGLRIGRTANLLSLVRKGELCSALITEVDELDRFYCKEVTTDQLGLFVARQGRIAELGWDAVDAYGLASLSPGKDGLPLYFQRYVRQFSGAKTFVLSESFEAIRAAAVAGLVVAVLPKRVARRHEDLLELRPPKALKHNGSHRILVVSQLKCDPLESDFLAEEASRLLN